ncbi:hypothetical protein CFP56_001307, partial [Quercus suber]
FLKARKCQAVLTRRVTPCSGTITNLNARECWYAGDSEKQNLDRIRDKITFSSVMANDKSTRPYSKWHISLWSLASPNNSMSKSFRIEFVCIRSPQIIVLLQYWDWNRHAYAF